MSSEWPYGTCEECGDNRGVEVIIGETFESEGRTEITDGPEVFLCTDGKYRCESCLQKLKAVQCYNCDRYDFSGNSTIDRELSMAGRMTIRTFCPECSEIPVE